MNKKIRVAVYGSLMKGLSNHKLLKDSEYVGIYYSLPIYSLYSLTYYPGLKLNGNTSVKFEVYKVTPEVFKKLDELEGVAQEYYVKSTVDTPYGPACIYVFNREVDERNLIRHGDWDEHARINNIEN